MASSIHNIIKTEYDKRRQRAEDVLRKKKDELYAKIPRLEEIEREIALAGLKHSRLVLLSGKNSAGSAAASSSQSESHPEAINKSLSDTISQLKNQRIDILTSNGYPADYLEPEYTCDRCKDTGFIEMEDSLDREYCPCYRQQQINLIHSQSNLKLTGEECFECFNENYYPDIVDEKRYGIKNTPRKQVLGIKDHCLSFIENFKDESSRNMLFSGPTGVGKTFMAVCVAVELMNRGITVLYQSAPVLFNTIYEYKYGAGRDDDYQSSIYKNIHEVELLIIDDLGTEPPTAARYAELLSILDVRAANNTLRPCKTIISTNADIKTLYEYYDERIASRIIGNFDIYRFAGEDIRKLKIGMGN
jgi:DNA replication protein DnaC